MKLPRRRFFKLAAGATLAPPISRFAWAQSYPVRPVRIIVGFPAGGQIDIIARLIAQWLSARLGQQFFIDNRPGAASNIATEALIRAQPDGYTLFLANGTNAVNASLYANLKFDFIRETEPVASINKIPLVLYVHPSLAAKSVSELIGFAKAHPGKLSIATPPRGTGPSMAAELFKIMANIDAVIVPYRADAQVVTDVLGGQLQVAFGGISPLLPHIKAEKLRALGVTTGRPSPMLPDVAAIADTVSGFEASGWCGIVAPRNTPLAILEKLHGEIHAALADPDIAARLNDAGVTELPLSRPEFGRFIIDETDKWAKVIRAANIKPD
jgi:tripartite-type tricarboxylate transporter receptor subunit TctC